MRTEVAQEMGRPTRFIVMETWKDQAAFDAHGKSTSTTDFRDKLKKVHAGPNDERIHNTLNVGANDPIAGKGGVIVASHVDVPPPRKDDLIAALNPLADGSRKGAATSASRCSSSRAALTTSPWSRCGRTRRRTTRAARPTRSASSATSFGPMLGALYDERLYQVVN